MKIKILFLIFLSQFLMACGGSSSNDDDTNDTTNSTPIQSIDATSTEDYVYYQFSGDNLFQVTPADPTTDTEWDIAFRRTNILLNGGASGSGNIGASLGVTQDQFYDNTGAAIASVFLNATADNEGQTAFETEIDHLNLMYATDSDNGAISSDWYNYDISTHIVTPNTESYWIIRSAAGDSYAKFRVTELTTSGRALATITIGIDTQTSSMSAFSGTEVSQTIDLSGGSAVCYDFDSRSTSDCSDTDWDLRFDPSFAIWLNSDVYGNGSGAIAYGAVFAVDDATFINTVDGATVGHWVADETAGTFEDDSWYAYNLQGGHQLWPNYRVYVIQDDTQYYKFQVVSYYSEQGVSGNLQVRVEELD